MAVSTKTEVVIEGVELDLYPQKGMLIKPERALLIADLHLGKINHFRKAGIPVPARANNRNMELLVELISLARPERVIFLGDLFHSHYNDEWESFGELRAHFRNLSFELVVGNHDILSDLQYQRKGIQLHERLPISSFLLTHHPLEDVSSEGYNLAGHVHPAVRLVGKGRQAMTLPCFHFGERSGLLPAFGAFTGSVPVHPNLGDRIFAILDNRIIPVA